MVLKRPLVHFHWKTRRWPARPKSCFLDSTWDVGHGDNNSCWGLLSGFLSTVHVHGRNHPAPPSSSWHPSRLTTYPQVHARKPSVCSSIVENTQEKPLRTVDSCVARLIASLLSAAAPSVKHSVPRGSAIPPVAMHQ